MYNGTMQLLRRGGSGLLLLLFQMLLLVFPVVLAASLLLKSPTVIQSTLKESGTYDHLIPAILNQSADRATQNGDTETAKLLQEQGVRDAAQKTFTPAALESTTNQAISGFYDWLQGKTSTPTITLDLSPYRQNLLNNLNTYALQKASSLPACNLQQLRELQAQPTQSVLEAPCLPPGMTAQQAADQFSKEAVQNSTFLNNPTISSQDLKDANGKPLFATASWLPTAYHWLMLAPWIIGALIALTALGSILLHEERWRGVRRVSIALIVTGLMLLAGSAAYWLFVGNFDRFITGTAAELQATIGKVMATSFGAYIRTVAMTGGAYAVLGAIGLVIALRQGRKEETKAVVTAPSPTTSTTPPTSPLPEPTPTTDTAKSEFENTDTNK
jgi:hypothetical protein